MAILLFFAWLIALPIILLIAGAVLLFSSVATLFVNIIPFAVGIFILFLLISLIALPFKPLIEKYETKITTLFNWVFFLLSLPLLGLIIIFPLYFIYSISYHHISVLGFILAILYIYFLARIVYEFIKLKINPKKKDTK